MNEINFKMPGFFDTGYDIITMKRGKDRRLNCRHRV